MNNINFSNGLGAFAPRERVRVASNLAHVARHPLYSKMVSAKRLAESGDATWGDPETDPIASVRPYNVVDNVLVLSISGTLVNDFDFAVPGVLTGYNYIQAAFSRALGDPDVHGVFLMINSPGGEVTNCFETVDMMYQASSQLPIAAGVVGGAFSAAYAFASLGSTISMTRTSSVGSIGVIALHVDETEALKMAGVSIVPIYAGDNKTNGADYQPLSEAARKEEQDSVDAAYDVFTATVARNRPVLTQDAVVATQAACYTANQAIANGLADRVSDVNTALFNFSNSLKGSTIMNKTEAVAAQANPGVEQVAAKSAPAAAYAAVDVSSQLEAARQEGMKAATARFSTILTSAEAEGRKALATHLATKTDVSAEVAIGILATASKEAPAQPIVSEEQHPQNGTLDQLSSAMAASKSPEIATATDTSLVNSKTAAQMTMSDLHALSKPANLASKTYI